MLTKRHGLWLRQYHFCFADVGTLQEKIEKFQKQISHTRVFGNGITRERRLEMFEMIQDIQKNVRKVV